MELKDLLGKYINAEQLDSVVEELNRELPKSYIVKSRFNEVNDELKLTKKQLEEKEALMTSLSQKASSVEEYEKKLADAQKQIADLDTSYKGQIANITKTTKFRDLLVSNNAVKDGVDLLVEKYSNEVELDGENIKEAEALINKIKTERSALFITKQEDSTDKGGNKKSTNEDDEIQAKLRKSFGLK